SFEIVNSDSAVTEIKNLVEGVYEFELRVTDNKDATAKSNVQVIVNAAPNKNPVANAGANQSITLPVNSVSLSGSATDEDGTIVSYQWKKQSGPENYNIVNANSPVTDVSGLTEGVYRFELLVTDNKGATASSLVQVTVR